jgi:hypothetical protein
MSDNVKEEKQEVQELNPLQEVRPKVTITPEDVAGAAEFWKYFSIEMPPELEAAFDTFSKEPSIENQRDVRRQICKAIYESDHEAFKDEMFKEVVLECRAVAYDMSFDDTLIETLTKE